MDIKQEKLRLRGHHLLCMNLIDFTGDPIYNAAFCANARRCQELMCCNPDQVVLVVPECGDTCLHCPHRNEADDKCFLYDYDFNANRIDLEVLNCLGLKAGDELKAGDLRRRIAKAFNFPASICTWACGLAETLNCGNGMLELKSTLSNGNR